MCEPKIIFTIILIKTGRFMKLKLLAVIGLSFILIGCDKPQNQTKNDSEQPIKTQQADKPVPSKGYKEYTWGMSIEQVKEKCPDIVVFDYNSFPRGWPTTTWVVWYQYRNEKCHLLRIVL